mmetsp:Transcript_2738/g.10542  ORF Transcript_2738/g.10542 Transcript_2738/m.10542 type:complete len:96 (+) Transcript_2738:4424-4711(+)
MQKSVFSVGGKVLSLFSPRKTSSKKFLKCRIQFVNGPHNSSWVSDSVLSHLLPSVVRAKDNTVHKHSSNKARCKSSSKSTNSLSCVYALCSLPHA